MNQAHLTDELLEKNGAAGKSGSSTVAQVYATKLRQFKSLHKSLGSYGYKGGEQLFRFGDVVPEEAKVVRVHYFTRCGNEGKSRTFTAYTFVQSEDGKMLCTSSCISGRATLGV